LCGGKHVATRIPRGSGLKLGLFQSSAEGVDVATRVSRGCGLKERKKGTRSCIAGSHRDLIGAVETWIEMSKIWARSISLQEDRSSELFGNDNQEDRSDSAPKTLKVDRNR